MLELIHSNIYKSLLRPWSPKCLLLITNLIVSTQELCGQTSLYPWLGVQQNSVLLSMFFLEVLDQTDDNHNNIIYDNNHIFICIYATIYYLMPIPPIYFHILEIPRVVVCYITKYKI